MAFNPKGRLLVIFAVVMLGLGASSGFSVAGDPLKRLGGDWCEDEAGCSDWWTLFRVEVDDKRKTIKIGYRDKRYRVDPVTGRRLEFFIFEGNIQPKVKWSIDACPIGQECKDKDKGEIGRVTATVNLEGRAELTDGKTKLMRKAQNETEETIDVSFEGDSVGEIVREKIKTEGDAAEGTHETHMTIKGKKVEIKGVSSRSFGTAKLESKIAKIDGDKITIDGKFNITLNRKDDGWRISGIYTPPPTGCSNKENERRRSEAEELAREYRIEKRGKENITAKPQRITSGRIRSEKEKMERRIRLTPVGRLLAEATGTVVGDEVAVSGRGRYVRRVGGTAKGGEISLDLPPLPVLDHKCDVVGTTKGPLKLVKQHGAIR